MSKAYSTASHHNVQELVVEDIRSYTDQDGRTFWVRELVVKVQGGTQYIRLFADNPDSLTLSFNEQKVVAK